MIDSTDVLIRLVGAFYVFAGVVATRAALTSRFADTVIAALDGNAASPVERYKSRWLIASSAVVFAGGVALFAGLDLARWLFLASAAGQAIYLFALAPHYFDRTESFGKHDPVDAQGRRQTTNAFVVYTAATLFVLWAGAVGRLIPLDAAPAWLLALAATAVVAFLGWIARHTLFGVHR